MSSGSRRSETVPVELRRRLTTATSDARRLLGIADGPVRLSEVEEVESLIACLESALAAFSPSGGWRSAGVAHASQIERLTHRHAARSVALSRVDEALGVLRQLTAPGTILTRAAKELCLNSRLERAVISLIRNGRLVPETAYFHDDPAGAMKVVQLLASDPAPLEHPLVEIDVLRRRRASIITDAPVHPRVYRPMTEAMGWQSFVAAPLVVGGDAIGLIHADPGASKRSLDVLDADVLWSFASGVAELYEIASLRRMVRRQQAELREFLEWLSARSGELNGASIRLGSDSPPPPLPPGRLEVVGSPAEFDDRLVFAEVLTRRELQVLRLLARGESNKSIAAALVISEGTVKFHVRNLLEKLRVSNRAQAVSRYHQVLRRGLAESR